MTHLFRFHHSRRLQQLDRFARRDRSLCLHTLSVPSHGVQQLKLAFVRILRLSVFGLFFAFIFGGIYALVLLAVAAARDHFGAAGLYTVAVISGLTDMDAITLSTAQLVTAARLDADHGWRVIVLASLANLIFKSLIVVAVGPRQLRSRIVPLFGLVLVAGTAILLLWPAA